MSTQPIQFVKFQHSLSPSSNLYSSLPPDLIDTQSIREYAEYLVKVEKRDLAEFIESLQSQIDEWKWELT